MVLGLFGSKSKAPATATIKPFEQTVKIAKGESLLQAALSAGVDFPHSCKVGTCVQCKCKLMSGSVKAIRDFSYVLSVDELQQGYILACQARVKQGDHIDVEVELEAGRPELPRVETQGQIQAIEDLTHDIKKITVSLNEKMVYVAGQYAELSLPGFDRPREYSFATAPDEGGNREVSFFIRHVPGGKFTDWLFLEDRTGEHLAVAGPSGNFWLRESPRPLLCIAGGSGLAPLKAIIEDALKRGVKRDLVLLFGARTEQDLYQMEQVSALGNQWAAEFELVPVLSDEPEASGWQGERGYVHTAIHDQVVSDLTNRQAYLCGPPVMIDAAIEVMKAAGIDSDNIFYDKFVDASSL